MSKIFYVVFHLHPRVTGGGDSRFGTKCNKLSLGQVSHITGNTRLEVSREIKWTIWIRGLLEYQSQMKSWA